MVGVLTLVLIELLAATTWLFFLKQQAVYFFASERWQVVERVYNFLQDYHLNQLTADSNWITATKLEILSDWRVGYQDASDLIHRTLENDSEPPNPIARNFYQQARSVLEQQRLVLQTGLTFINLQHCLLQHLMIQKQLIQEVSASLQWLESTADSPTIRATLLGTVNQIEQLSEIAQLLPGCFNLVTAELQVQAWQLGQPIVTAYDQYRTAIHLFVSGMDNLRVDEMAAALQMIRSRQINDSISQLDTFIKTNLEQLYKTHTGQKQELERHYQNLKQAYLEIRLRTLFR